MIFYTVLFLLCLIDRVTKIWAVTVCQYSSFDVNSWFTCSFALNRGVSWSLFHSDSPIQFFFVTLLVMVVVGFIVWSLFYNMRHGYSVYGEWLVLVGACSNLVDRFWYGGVVDFVLLHYQGWVWPLFNVADALIVIGIILMLFRDLRR